VKKNYRVLQLKNKSPAFFEVEHEQARLPSSRNSPIWELPIY